ncbi:SET domain-containing protein SmydA-8 [Sabethes cyaneus]|uniref:SET domain-containing protein SmydA-8 n=1 Tax=Sabethes cyaneus TaxID=53552 RepID=UPI00237EE193|nr:SET domain-containing protein SmydA-8 [Sabethes cyaneus]
MPTELCAVCGIPAGQRCSGCQQVTYCGREHQRRHWKDAHRAECRCYKVSRNAILGRHLAATRPIRRGEIIYRDPPMLIGPKINSVPLCLGCHRNLAPQLPAHNEQQPASRKTLYTCRHCGWPLCGPSCESSSLHTDECQLFRSRNYRPHIVLHENEPKRKDPAYCVIVPLRAIMLAKKDPRKYAKMRTFESHLETRTSTPLYAVLKSNLVPFIRNVLGLHEFGEDELLQLAGIMDTNSYEIRVPKRDIKIRGIYELGAMMSHDCRPNTKHFFDEQLNMVLVAAVDIRKDDVICTSYCQPLLPTIQRRYVLKLAKCFECLCDRCRDPTELGTYLGSIICPKCSQAKMIATNPLDFRSDWQCQRSSEQCSYRESAQRYVQRNETFQAEIMALRKSGTQYFERFLDTFQETTLHPWNANVLQVKYALCQLYDSLLEGPVSTQALTEQQKRRQVELCRDLLAVAEILEPGQSLFRAKLLLHLRAALIALLPTQVQSKQPNLENPAPEVPTGAKTKQSLASDRTVKRQQLERVQQELEEMLRSDPTLDGLL